MWHNAHPKQQQPLENNKNNMPIIEGKAYWANITVPNTTYEPCYTIDLVVDEENAAKFKAEGYNVKDKDNGPTLTIKRKVLKKDGSKRPVPKLMDAKKQPLDESVGNGSYVRVQYRPWEMGEYKGLELQAVQVIDLVIFGGADGEEFEAIDDYEDGEL